MPPMSCYRLAAACSPALRHQPMSAIAAKAHLHERSVRLLLASGRPQLLHRRQASISLADLSGTAHFHSTPKVQGAPLLPFLVGALKVSTAMEVVRTAGRIALSFVPIILFKNHATRKILKHVQTHGDFKGRVITEEEQTSWLQKMRKRTILFHILVFTPVTLFWLTILASLERTPLTGRWRLIVLSPEEEDEIAAQLAGPGWYQAVRDILVAEGSPPIVPASDWRYQWVRSTLRQLESAIPTLQVERDIAPEWIEREPKSFEDCDEGEPYPLPPPADYPLKPRPRGTDSLRHMCELMCARKAPTAAHVIQGPPYALAVVDNPDASNAFSYGFGPDGGGGIVVYSGFIDDVLSRADQRKNPPPPVADEGTSWWTYLFGGVFGSSSAQRQHAAPAPTPEQTSELAILLAHELAHLVLAHHLETLSSTTVIFPGVLSMLTDFLRALLFPATMLFGPFVNDAVAQLGKIGSGDLVEVGEYCTSMAQEYEADVVSTRLLAHAGFDARKTIKFWETREASPKTAECTHTRAEALEGGAAAQAVRKIAGPAHPVNDERVQRLRGELHRWQQVRDKARAKLEAERRAATE